MLKVDCSKLRVLPLVIGIVGFSIGVWMIIEHVPPQIAYVSASGLALGVAAWVVIAVSVKGIERTPRGRQRHSVKNQLLFALLGICSLGLFGLVIAGCGFPEGVLSVIMTIWAVTSLLWVFIGGWIIIVHAVGLILAIGRRLPLLNRLALYYLAAGVPTILAYKFAQAATTTGFSQQ